MQSQKNPPTSARLHLKRQPTSAKLHQQDQPASEKIPQQQSFFTRTTLDERIFLLTGGSELIPITILPNFIHIQYQSIKNLIGKGKFPLPIVRFAGRNFVRTESLVRFLEQCEQGESPPIRRRVGRPSNKQRALTANVGEV